MKRPHSQLKEQHGGVCVHSIHPVRGSAPLHAARPPHWGPCLWVSDRSLSLKELRGSQGPNDDTLHPPSLPPSLDSTQPGLTTQPVLVGYLVRGPRPSYLRESWVLITTSFSGRGCCLYVFTVKTGQKRSDGRHSVLLHGCQNVPLSASRSRSSPQSS